MLLHGVAMGLIKHLTAVVPYAAALLITYILTKIVYRLFFHPLRRIPGPLVARCSGLYGAFYAGRSRLHHKTLHDHQRYGPVLRQGPNKVVFNTVSALHSIYQGDQVTKSQCYMITQRTPGIYGLFNVIDRQLHRAKRKLVAKVVSDQSIRKFEPTLLAEVDVFLHKLHHHATVDDGDAGVNMSMLFSHLTMDVMGHLAFAHPLSLQTETRFRFMIQGSAAANYYLNIAMQLSFLASLHILSYRWIRALLRGQNYFEALDQMIKTQLEKSDKSKQDLLFMTDTMRVNEDTEQAVKEIRSEAIFFLTAGSDTTTITLSALFFYLAQSPAAYQRLTQEVRSAFAQEEDIRSSPELSGCIFLRACIDEALRMNPPLPGTLWRQQVASASKTEPLVIDGHLIPAGTEVGVNAYALHHNEEYFPDPFTFHPERWLAEAGEGAANRSAFIPFSIGARSCAGKSMAYTEISLIVAKTLWHFDFELAAGGAGTLASSNWAGDPKDSRSPLQGDAVFPMLDHFTAAQDGPFLRFRQRKGLPCTR